MEPDNGAPDKEGVMTILECPQCFSNRAAILDTKPPTARCVDCEAAYSIRYTHVEQPQDGDQPEQPPPKKRKKKKAEPPEPQQIDPRDFGALTNFINEALQAGPEGLRKAQRKANNFARKLGLTYLEPQWFASTPWLLQWASGDIDTSGYTHRQLALAGSSHLYRDAPNGSSDNRCEQRDSRLRARAATRWRARWLTHFAMSASKAFACRNANVSEHTADFHIKNDPDFAAMVEAAKAHAIDLLHTRMMQRSLEGDIEPIYWQGICVDHVRRFDSRLQIEMARAHMPDEFKTPGQALINVDTGDKILVMDEATRAKLIDRRREHLIAQRAEASP